MLLGNLRLYLTGFHFTDSQTLRWWYVPLLEDLISFPDEDI